VDSSVDDIGRAQTYDKEENIHATPRGFYGVELGVDMSLDATHGSIIYSDSNLSRIKSFGQVQDSIFHDLIYKKMVETENMSFNERQFLSPYESAQEFSSATQSCMVRHKSEPGNKNEGNFYNFY